MRLLCDPGDPRSRTISSLHRSFPHLFLLESVTYFGTIFWSRTLVWAMAFLQMRVADYQVVIGGEFCTLIETKVQN